MTWEILIICITAFGASILTFFSGFGLGTLLLPAFSLFFSLPTAIGATAIVHLLNNLFKLLLLGKHFNRFVVTRFGFTAIVFSVLGAMLQQRLGVIPPVCTWSISESSFQITSLGLVIGLMMLLFGMLEFLPAVKKWSFPPSYAWLGGIISGFFGGLSGHQGALRSAFLIRYNLTRDELLASGVVIACMIDVGRIFVYLSGSSVNLEKLSWISFIIILISALSGSLVGNYYLKKMTLSLIRQITAIFILIIATLLIIGVL